MTQTETLVIKGDLKCNSLFFYLIFFGMVNDETIVHRKFIFHRQIMMRPTNRMTWTAAGKTGKGMLGKLPGCTNLGK